MVVSQPVLWYHKTSAEPCLGRKIVVKVQIVGITPLSDQPRLALTLWPHTHFAIDPIICSKLARSYSICNSEVRVQTILICHSHYVMGIRLIVWLEPNIYINAMATTPCRTMGANSVMVMYASVFACDSHVILSVLSVIVHPNLSIGSSLTTFWSDCLHVSTTSSSEIEEHLLMAVLDLLPKTLFSPRF